MKHFIYTNEPDGYGASSYNGNDDNYLKNTYRYSTVKTDMRGAKTKYTFDGKGQLINTEEFGNDHRQVITTTFDANKLPQKKEWNIYNVLNGVSSGNPVKQYENYAFDDYGNMTTYTGTLAPRDANGIPTSTNYNINYTYATDKFNILTSKLWKKDAVTSCKTEYDVDAKGNVTQERNIHTGNNVVTDFKHDSFGNLISSTIHYSDNSGNTYTKNYEYGIDKNGVDQKGAYLTKEYSTLDGVQISKQYTYDFNTGNLKESYDENNNKTSYQHDELNRISIITYADNTNKKYNYYDYYASERKIIVFDQRGIPDVYCYDTFGNLLNHFRGQTFADNQWQCTSIEQMQYDSNGSKIKDIDANGNSTRYVYDSANRLIQKSFWEKDSVQKKNMIVNYTNGSDANTPLLVSITDEEGYIKKYHYDISNRLIKMDYAPDKINYVSELYTLDYMSNITNSQDFKGISTVYMYDDLNRLVQQKNAATGLIQYFYDAKGNKIKEIDARVNSMYWDYDALGRLIRKRVPRSDGLTEINRYIYDSAGNKIKEINPNFYNLSKDTPALVSSMTGVSYTYNCMNKSITTLSPEGSLLEARKYDADGNLIKVVDGLRYSGNIDSSPGTTYIYDYFNRITDVDNALNQCVKHNTYDNAGNQLSQKDGNGNIINYEYYSDRTLKTITYPSGGGNIQYTYDKLGRKLTQIDQLGNNTSYSYNGYGLVTITDDAGRYLKNYYDTNGNIVKKEELRKAGVYDVTKYEYDVLNRVTKSIKLVDESDVYSATGIANIAAIRDTDYPGKVQLITGYEYDANGNKTKAIDPRAYSYLTSDTTRRNNYSISYSYDEMNRVKTVTRVNNGSNVSLQYTYDLTGNKNSEKSERGFISSYSYDNMNRIKSITDECNNVISNGYDLIGNKTTVTNAKGTITYGYDILNRQDTIKDPSLKIISKKTFDVNNNVLTESDAKGFVGGYCTTYTYDSMNRLQTVTEPEMYSKYSGSKNTIKYLYNNAGQKTNVTDALSNSTKYQYDATGRLLNVTDPLNKTTVYGYDLIGNMTSMKNGRGKTTSYSFGAFGILTGVSDAENKPTAYKYNLGLNIASMVDANGSTTLYTYDILNNILSRNVVSTGDNISYAYDESGNRQSMTDGTGTTTYNYYNNDNLKQILKNSVAQLSYVYDGVGNVIFVKDSKGFVTTYDYDSMSRMKTVTFNGNTTIYAYEDNGNRHSITYPGGMTETYSYNKNNKILTLTNKKPDGSAISSYSYTYYDNGLQNTKTDSYGTTTYTYDLDGRVLQVTAPGKTTQFTYDDAGNRQSSIETYTSDQISGYKDDAGNDIKYKIKNSQYSNSDSNHLIQLSESMCVASGNELLNRIITYRYDGNGNQTSQTSEFIKPTVIGASESINIGIIADGVSSEIDKNMEMTSNTFDGFNRLKRVDSIKAGSRIVTDYKYNGDDLRVAKTVKKSSNNYTPDETDYLYDGQNVILETDASNNVKVRYIKGINYIARIDSINKTSYMLFNGHGDVVQTVALDGTIENSYDYDTFGNSTLTVEKYSNAIRYSSEYLDNETGLYYLRARYYDSYQGRFISEDSFSGSEDDPLSLNLYTYCGNDPINKNDPSGHYAVAITDGGSASSLKIGSNGYSVKDLQTKLLAVGISVGSCGADGDFGSATRAAVMQYQKSHGLAVDGIAGPKTLNALNFSYSEYSATPAVTKGGIQTKAKVTGNQSSVSNTEILADKVINIISPGATERADKALTTPYNFLNYASNGLLDIGKGAIFPEKPLSLDHWVDSAVVVAILAPTVRALGDEARTIINSRTTFKGVAEPNIVDDFAKEVDFIVTSNGTAVHASQAEMIESITNAGAIKIGPTSQTTEIGEIFQMSTKYGPMETRVMPGQPGSTSLLKGPRTINTVPGTGEYVYPNGERIRGAVSKSDRKGIGHIHGQK